jgi:hypothetical protein
VLQVEAARLREQVQLEGEGVPQDMLDGFRLAAVEDRVRPDHQLLSAIDAQHVNHDPLVSEVPDGERRLGLGMERRRLEHLDHEAAGRGELLPDMAQAAQLLVLRDGREEGVEEDDDEVVPVTAGGRGEVGQLRGHPTVGIAGPQPVQHRG